MSKELDELFQAIRDKKLDTVKIILSKDKSLINETDIDGWSPIHICAADGNKQIMTMLIEEFNADVNQRTEYRYTPLHLAAKYGNVECLFELMKHNADSSLTNRGSSDVLDFLVQVEPKLQSIIEYTFKGSCHLELKEDHLKIVGDSTEYDIHNILIS